jgi:hypothetical protein
VNVVDAFCTHVEVILRRGGDESNQGILYGYMEMSQRNPCKIVIYL